MSMLRSVPEPQITLTNSASIVNPDRRQVWVEEFLQAKALTANSQRAYRQDIKTFLSWTDRAWEAVTISQMVQFKSHLMTIALAPATVRRIFSTLNSFYTWLMRCGYVNHNPTDAIELPKIPEPEADYLTDQQVQQIFQAAIETPLAERNLALLWVLSHNLRASEVCALDMADYDGQRLHIRQAKADSKGVVPLNQEARSWLAHYLQWRESQGEIFLPTSPLFISHSRQNQGARLGYGGIRKLMDGLSTAVGFKFHAHQFRHTYATNLMLAGMNPYHIMTLTRHKSPQNFRRYSKAADRIAAEKAFYAAIGETSSESDLIETDRR
jgi:integrase/recombinase XerD